MDKTLKVWDLRDQKPECVVEKNFKIGPLHCASFCPDAALAVALGGNKGCFRLWDAAKSAAVKQRWRRELEGVGEENEKGDEVKAVMNEAADGDDDGDSDDDDDDDLDDDDDDEEDDDDDEEDDDEEEEEEDDDEDDADQDDSRDDEKDDDEKKE